VSGRSAEHVRTDRAGLEKGGYSGETEVRPQSSHRR
jgi:hypothetical protein